MFPRNEGGAKNAGRPPHTQGDPLTEMACGGGNEVIVVPHRAPIQRQNSVTGADACMSCRLPATTPVTTVLGLAEPPTKVRKNTSTASERFIVGPATRMMKRCQGGLAPKLSGASSSPFSPAIFTKPPRGIALIEYRTPPRRQPLTRGGKPRPNSSTRTPKTRAIVKCPSSWTRIRTVRMTIKAKMPRSVVTCVL